ncbi:HNH endonuclease signature motif containing protein [Nocardioides jishulii]|uniref:HNH endonuclease n=1 Tax=Nocardioides jishulii TaxID=2575440 RepID=A0A4V6X5Z9_9ACTN|nr:HNH endonuclease signature motif containing protein [Nocardioides jishulii]QCX26697.1 HNH endonuclease [Nocardioides jishulii]TKI60333.1 HNH endonuclease [Nocardioides jishulii]
MFEDVTTPGDLVALARANAAAVRRAEADTLLIAYEWAVAHPAKADGSDAAAFHSQFGIEAISGEGTPEVDEYAVPELGGALGLSTDAAKKLIGHALELAHRLPRLWARVTAGEVPVWRARLVAEATIHACPALPAEGVAWIDQQVAPFIDKTGRAQIDRLIERAMKLYGLATEDDDTEQPDPRHVRIDTEAGAFTQTMRVEAELDIADALDLEQAVAAGAAGLKAGGSEESLDVRRSLALGELARHQTALDLAGAAALDDVVERTTARRVDLHLHFTAAVEPDESLSFSATGHLENRQRLILLEQVRRWVNTSHTDVRILPVVDLNESLSTARYEPTDRLRRQVQLRDETCVFPHCTRPSRRCDVDHVVPFEHDATAEGRPQPGPTTTDNLATLCRGHHRLKTHTGWRLESPANGVFEWTSPHGQRFRRDRDGTTDLTPELARH